MSRMTERTRRIKALEIGESVTLPVRNERELRAHRSAIQELKRYHRHLRLITRKVPEGLLVWRLAEDAPTPDVTIGNERYGFEQLREPGDVLELAFITRGEGEKAINAARKWAGRRGWRWTFQRGAATGSRYLLRVRFEGYQ